jgi:hypothetical protein
LRFCEVFLIEEKENIMNVIEKLTDTYSSKTGLQALAQLIPYWGVADTLLKQKADEIKKERLHAFFDELDQGQHELSNETIESEEFLHAYFCTVRAATNTLQREKIKQLARLLRSATVDGTISLNDEYEELLGILTDLSYREIIVLTLLDKYEMAQPQENDENDLQHANRYWSRFSQEVVSTLGVREDELDTFMTRLNRTGCYETFTGSFWDNTGGKGKITPVFRRLKALAIDRIENDG